MHSDATRRNFYAGSGIDRASHLRKDEAWLSARLRDPGSRIVPVWRSRNLVGGDPPAAGLLAPEAADGLLADGAEIVFLGLVEDAARFAVDISGLEAPEGVPALAGLGDFADLRQVGPLLGREDGAMLAYARGVLTWHRRHRFCGQCGAPTESTDAGHVRVCTSAECGISHFPRTDPAVIMLVSHGDSCLLGRQAVWPKGMHSTLAGFVEPGESLEEAVAREVFEEAGVRVRDVRYHSSQPWPFPTSLMLGFHAEAASTELEVNRDELEDARWFTRSWILENENGEDFRLPRPDSIARRLVEGWLGRG